MNPVQNAILHRRSIRKFQKESSLPREAVHGIVEAGLYAPSARNRQPWHITAVLGHERIDRLTRELKAAVVRMPENPYKDFVGSAAYTVNYHAPAFMLVSADPAVSVMAAADCAAVLQNMFLAAHALGIGSCWINQLGSACDEPGFRALLTEYGVPERNFIYGCGAFGYGDGEPPAAPERKAGTVNYVG